MENHAIAQILDNYLFKRQYTFTIKRPRTLLSVSPCTLHGQDARSESVLVQMQAPLSDHLSFLIHSLACNMHDNTSLAVAQNEYDVLETPKNPCR